MPGTKRIFFHSFKTIMDSFARKSGVKNCVWKATGQAAVSDEQYNLFLPEVSATTCMSMAPDEGLPCDASTAMSAVAP
jgi:hypothetical protein